MADDGARLSGAAIDTAPVSKTGRYQIALNLILILGIFALVRLELKFYFDITTPDLISISGAFTAGGLGILISLVPKRTHNRLLLVVRSALSERLVTVLACLFLTATVAAACFTRYDLVWRGGPNLKAAFNSSNQSLDGHARDDLSFEASVFRPAFIPVKISIRSFSTNRSSGPLSKSTILVPYYASSGGDPRIASAEGMLLRAFYQFFEQRQLDAANASISSISTSTQFDRALVFRLKDIYNILYHSLGSGSSQDLDAVSQLTSNFEAQYPGDPWNNLLRAATQYAKRDYRACAKNLDNPYIGGLTADGYEMLGPTASFFRGICRLKAASQALLDPQRIEELRSALSDFNAAEGAIKNDTGSPFTDLAHPSSVIFSGITEFYIGEMDQAIDTLQRAAELSNGSIKARALNAAGFVDLVQGRIPEAENLLLQSLNVDANFPYARSNYALVKISEGKFPEARNLFLQNASDLDLQSMSPRDVILAKLSLAELYDQEGGHTLPEINEQFATLMRQIKLNGYDGVAPPEVRYGYLAQEAAEKIYLGGAYYGLEIFALSLMCKAEERLSIGQVADDAVGTELRISLRGITQDLRKKISPAWFSDRHGAWFSPLDRCFS